MCNLYIIVVSVLLGDQVTRLTREKDPGQGAVGWFWDLLSANNLRTRCHHTALN